MSLVGNPRREYVVAYIAPSGNICPMATKNTPTVLLKYALEDAEAMRSPEDEAEVFVAYRDVPPWQRLTDDTAKSQPGLVGNQPAADTWDALDALIEHARRHRKRADDAGRLARHVLEVLGGIQQSAHTEGAGA